MMMLPFITPLADTIYSVPYFYSFFHNYNLFFFIYLFPLNSASARDLSRFRSGVVALHIRTADSTRLWDLMDDFIRDNPDACKELLQLRHMAELARCHLVAQIARDFEVGMHFFASKDAEHLGDVENDVLLQNINILQHDYDRSNYKLKEKHFGFSVCSHHIRSLDEIFYNCELQLFSQLLVLQDLKGDDDLAKVLELVDFVPNAGCRLYAAIYLRKFKEWECNGSQTGQTIEEFRKHMLEYFEMDTSENISHLRTRRHEFLKRRFREDHLRYLNLSRKSSHVAEAVVVPRAVEVKVPLWQSLINEAAEGTAQLRRLKEEVERGAKEKLRRVKKEVLWEAEEILRRVGTRGAREVPVGWPGAVLAAGVTGLVIASRVTLKTKP